MAEYEAATGYIQLVPSGRGFGPKAKAELQRINLDKQVDLDANAAKLNAKVEAARERLESLQRVRADPKLDADITLLRARIAQSEARLAELGRKTASPKVDVDTAAEQAKLARLSQQLDELGRKRSSPKVDADIRAAQADLARVTRQHSALEGKRAQMRLDADTSPAATKLRQAASLIDSIGSKRVELQIRGGSLRTVVTALSGIIALLAGVVAAAGPAAAGIAAIGAGAVGLAATAGVGITALVAGFSGVGDAITGVESAQKSAASGASSSASQQVSATRQIESAVRSLQQAQTQQARTAVSGAEQVASAVRSLQQAQTQQARTAANGQRQIQSAVRALQQAQQGADRAAITGAQQVASARRALADTQVQAARSVADAERSLSATLAQQRLAQEALTEARRDAVRSLEDMQLAASGAGLSQERAQIGLERARQRLAAANESGLGQGLERQELELDVREAQQSLAEVSLRYQRLRADTAEATRAGVEGSAQVVSAQRQLQAAQQATSDAARQLARAQVDGARSVQSAQTALAQTIQQAGFAQADAARGVADAERGVADARRSAAQANADAARSTADAERNLAVARRDAAQSNADAARAVADAQRALSEAQADAARTAAGAAGGADKLEEALKDLSPAGREFVLFWVNEFKPRMREVSTAVASTLLPRIQTALRRTYSLIPTFRDGLADTGRVVGDLADEGARMITSGPWRRDFATIIGSSNRQLGSYGRAGFQVADAFRSIVVESGPMLERFARATERGAEMFNTWIQGKRDSGELGAFFDRTGDGLSKAWDFAVKLAKGAKDLYEELKPLGTEVQNVLPDLVEVGKALGSGWVEALTLMAPHLTPLVQAVGDLARLFNGLPDPVKGVVGSLVLFALWGPRIVGAASGLAGGLAGAVRSIGALARGDWRGAFTALENDARKTGRTAGTNMTSGFASGSAGSGTAGRNAGNAAGRGVSDGFVTGAGDLGKKGEDAGRKGGRGVMRGLLAGVGRALGPLALAVVAFEIVDAVTGGKATETVKAVVDSINNMITGDPLSPSTIAFNEWQTQNAASWARWTGSVNNDVNAGIDQWNQSLINGTIRMSGSVDAGFMRASNAVRGSIGLTKTFTDDGYQQITDGIRAKLDQLPPDVAARMTATGGSLRQGLSDMQRLSTEGIAGVEGAIKAGIVRVPPEVQNAGQDAVRRFKDALAKMPPDTRFSADATTRAAKDALRPLPGDTAGTGQAAVDRFKSGIRGMPGIADRAGIDTKNSFNGAVRPLPGDAQNAGQKAGDGFGSGITGGLKRAYDGAVNWLRSMRDMFVNWFRGLPSWARGAISAPAALFAQGGLIAPMAQGGVLQADPARPVVANAAGRTLSPMSGATAQMVPANTWRVIGDNMRVPELFAPLNGSRRTAALLAQAVAHEGYVMLTRRVLDQLVAGRQQALGDARRQQLVMARLQATMFSRQRDLLRASMTSARQQVRPVAGYAAGAIIQASPAVRAKAAAEHRYDGAAQAVRGQSIAARPVPPSAPARSTTIHQDLSGSSWTPDDAFRAANFELARGRLDGGG